jgi:hypothetical protein
MNDVHPIQDSPADMTLIERVHLLECALARLWDQVWWMNLPDDRRAIYEADGFKAPIQNFYARFEDVSRGR